MDICESERIASSERRDFATINGKVKVQPNCSISGDSLLRVAQDTDSNHESDSELSENGARHTDRQLVNKPKTPQEKFEPHRDDPLKIEAIFHVKLADGSGWYTQRDVLPEQRDSAEEDKFSEDDTLFFPDLAMHKVPPRPNSKKGTSYVPWAKTSGWQWTRIVDGKTEFWSPVLVFRRFHARTHRYQRVYVSERRMSNIDPNNKSWVYSYHKWIDQIKRRSDSSYVLEKRRDHWTVPEIRAMYAGINDFLYTNGIDAYYGIKNVSLQKILDAINVAGNKNRGIESLRGQLNSSHKSKNPSIAYLHENARDLARYLADGGVVSDAERFPKNFIPEEEFPTAPRGNTRKQGKAKKSLEQGIKSEADDADDEMQDDDSDQDRMSGEP